ncbi:MAG: protein BatD [Deltaproteobacteria bacterium]|nr:protein BatD [Deltaproteobacteria bacterium]
MPRLAAALLTGLLAALAPAGAAAADVEFFATTDRDEMGLDETLTLTVTVALDAGAGSEGEELRLPEAPDFEVLSRSKSQQTSFVMGRGPPSFRNSRVFSLILQPRHAGTCVIPPGRLVYRGKTYETGALRIKVVAGGVSRPGRRQPPPSTANPSQPFNPFGQLGNILGGQDPDAQELLNEFFGGGHPQASDSDLFLVAYLDKKQAYLGEQVTLAIYLYSRVDVTGIDGFKMPKLDGFWSEDTDTPKAQITGEPTTYDGISYRRFLLRRSALFPLKAGKLTIDPVEVEISTGFSLIIDGGRKLKRKTQTTSLEALPLPPGAPAAFETPNVGQWRLSAEASPTHVQLGQPVMLKITLEGAGNLHDVVSPRLPAIPGVTAYEPTLNEKTAMTKGRFGGRRVLEYLLKPEQSGAFEIPSLALHYFDPVAREYKAASTQAIPVRVEAGAGAAAGQAGGNRVALASPSGTNVLDQGIRALRFKGDLHRPAPPLYRRPFFAPIAAAPILLWLALATAGLLRSSLQPSAGSIQRGLAGKARRRLKVARALLKAKRPDEFYAEVSQALHCYLAARLAAPVAGLTRTDLSAKLAAAGAKPEIVAGVTALLDTCDAGRFAPGGSTSATMERVLESAEGLMVVLDGSRLAVTPLERAS